MTGSVPDMDESFALVVIYRRDSDLAKDDCPVRAQRAGDEDEVLV